MKRAFSSNYQGSSLLFSIPLGTLIVAALFIALPLTQILSNITNMENDDKNSRVQVQPPPPPPPEPPEKEEEEQKEEDIEMKKETQQLTLDQINMALNAGDGGMTASGVSVQVFDIADNFDDMVFEIADLDKPPVPLVRIAPVYPPELKRNRVQGTVNVVFIVDEFGNVKRPSIEKSSNREFNENALKAVRQWKFEPGEKDNKKVKTRVRLPLSFTLRR
ncbi:MAG: energy transducer TonB [Verrucomicrobiae bacterium]|nr:energy transducer TonB [Verrucomicrobiae bacterium]